VKYELKEGENRITVPNMAEIVCSIHLEDKMCVVMEADTDEREFTDRAFLVVKVGDEIKEGMVLNYVGCGYIPAGLVVVFEIL
jgi:hypothetical protein